MKKCVTRLHPLSVRKRFWILCLFVLPGCSQQVTLAYSPGVIPVRIPDAATIAQVTVKDDRKEADPTWIGAIRGGFGNPVKVLHLSQPLSDVIATAFRNALNARGILASGNPAPFDLVVTVSKFESTQMARREAEASLTLDVIYRTTGRGLYHDTTDVDLVSGSILALDTGVFASPADLQALAQNALPSNRPAAR